MRDGGEPCEKCGRFKGYFMDVISVPAILCIECRRDLHNYLVSLPEYRKLAAAKYCLSVLAPLYNKRSIPKYFSIVVDLEIKLGNLAVEWIKGSRKKADIVSLTKRKSDGED